jgi:hypothetical protein
MIKGMLIATIKGMLIATINAHKINRTINLNAFKNAIIYSPAYHIS